MGEIEGDDAARMLNEEILDGWARAMGMRYVRANGAEVVAALEIDDRHRQPYGIVHGGVHAGMIESAASVGAALAVLERGQTVVGLENHTTFLRAARDGRLRVEARPLIQGRSSQVWEGEVRSDEGQLLATGRVRVLCLDAKASLVGSPVSVRRSAAGHTASGNAASKTSVKDR